MEVEKKKKTTLNIPHQTEFKQVTDLLLSTGGCLRTLQFELILGYQLGVWEVK